VSLAAAIDCMADACIKCCRTNCDDIGVGSDAADGLTSAPSVVDDNRGGGPGMMGPVGTGAPNADFLRTAPAGLPEICDGRGAATTRAPAGTTATVQ
jgi:hypothetical protein